MSRMSTESTIEAPLPSRLRPMRWRDLDAVQEIEQASFPDDAWSPESWWAELAQRPSREYLIAERCSADETTGPAGLMGYAGLNHTAGSADVMTIAVRSDIRGAGLGGQLLSALLQRAAVAGAEQVLLEVRADNDGAIALYRRHGFETIHVRPGYYRCGASTASTTVSSTASNTGSTTTAGPAGPAVVAVDAWVMRAPIDRSSDE